MDTTEFEAFYREHYGSILATAHLRLGNYPDAQDITAEVFRVVWQRYQEGTSPTLPSAYQTLRNLAETNIDDDVAVAVSSRNLPRSPRAVQRSSIRLTWTYCTR